jgi:hypothetical protein
MENSMDYTNLNITPSERPFEGLSEGVMLRQ